MCTVCVCWLGEGGDVEKKGGEERQLTLSTPIN